MPKVQVPKVQVPRVRVPNVQAPEMVWSSLGKLIAADLGTGLGVWLELGWKVVWSWCGSWFGAGWRAGWSWFGAGLGAGLGALGALGWGRGPDPGWDRPGRLKSEDLSSGILGFGVGGAHAGRYNPCGCGRL